VQRKTVTSPLTEEEKVQLDGAKLVGLQVLFRHGARIPTSPLKQCFNVPNFSMEFDCGIRKTFQEVGDNIENNVKLEAVYPKFTGRCGTGRIQDEAKGQFEELAKALREHYDFDALNIVAEKTWLRADEIPRTQASMYLLVNKLFPGKGVLKLNVKPEQIDAWSGNPNCPQMKKARDSIADTADLPIIPGNLVLDSREHSMATLYTQVTGTFFRPVSTKDCLTEAVCTPQALPPGFTKELFEWAMNKSIHAEQTKYNARPDISQVMSAEVMFDLQDTFNAQVRKDGRRAPPLALYSTHDTTLISLLVSIGLWDGKWPTYAEAIIIEAYQKVGKNGEEEGYFRLLRAGRPLQIPACGGRTICPARIFASFGMPTLRNPDQMALYCQGEAGLQQSQLGYFSYLNRVPVSTYSEEFASRATTNRESSQTTDRLFWFVSCAALVVFSATCGFVAALYWTRSTRDASATMGHYIAVGAGV
jgi:hypothetical protein